MCRGDRTFPSFLSGLIGNSDRVGMVVSVALVDGGFCLWKPFFQAMFLAGCVVELVVLVAIVAEDFVGMNLERVTECNPRTSFYELDGHAQIVTSRWRPWRDLDPNLMVRSHSLYPVELRGSRP